MIRSAGEFIDLCHSIFSGDRQRRLTEGAKPAVWKAIIEHYPEYAVRVVENRNVPLAVLEILAQMDERVRMGVARRGALSPELFEQLANDESPFVRMKLAANRRTPVHLLMQLVNDVDCGVVRVAERNLSGRKGLVQPQTT